MLRRLWTWLWIATTPLAVTVLAAETEPTVAEHGAQGEREHLITNPIENVTYLVYKSRGLPAPFSMQVLNFAVFLFILGKYAGPSMKKAVRERHERIKKDLEEGARLRAEAQRRVDEYGRKLASLDAEMQVQAEIQRVRLVLEREAVVAAVTLAEKLLIDKTTDVDQKALADRFLKALV